MTVQNISTLKNKTKPSEVTIVPSSVKELMVWEAPIRPFKKRSKEYFSTITAIVFLVAVILIFVKEWLLVLVIISLTFLVYVLAAIPPEQVIHKITTRGIKTGERTYKWDLLNRFWFAKKMDCEILIIETKMVFPSQIQLILKDKNKKDVKQVVEKYLLYEKPEKTAIDKAAKWLQEKVPLES